MNHLFNIMKKELKELMTPASVISVLAVVVIFIGIGTMIHGEVDKMSNPSAIGLLNGDEGGEWSDFAVESVYIYYESVYNITREEASRYIIMLGSPYGDNAQITREMIDKGLETAFGVAPYFTQNIKSQVQTSIDEYYVFQNSGLLKSASSAVSATIIPWISDRISQELVSAVTDPLSAGFMLHPIKTNSPSSPNTHTYIRGEVYDGVTPIEISASVTSQTTLVPVVIMIVIVMIGSMVISSMGNEKENKTLETLLTMPVKRTTIVSGKLLASAIMGLVFGMAYMVGMMFYMGGLTSAGGGINLNDYGLSLGAADWIITGVIIFLAIFCALGLCMILGAFTKNFKAAQTMTLPISVLAMIPMFITMFSSWDSLPGVLQVIMFAIPFTHPMMVMNNLMFGNMTLVLAGLVYLLIFTAVTIMATVRIYKSDILVTGVSQTRASKIFLRKR